MCTLALEETHNDQVRGCHWHFESADNTTFLTLCLLQMMQLTSIYPPLRAVNFEPIFKHRRHYECRRPAVATPLSGHGILACAKVSIWNLLGYIANI